MAAPKTTPVSAPAFSTILSGRDIDRSIHKTVAVDSAERDAQFKQTHGMSREDWDVAVSLHLHGDQQ